MPRAAEKSGSSLVYGLRRNTIPRAPERLGIEKHWCLTDSKKASRRRPHPLLGKTSISYALNSAGYRCPDFDTDVIDNPSNYQLVVMGGSETFGVGLPASCLYVNLLASMLEAFTGKKVVAWNLGLPLAGSSYMARMVHPVITNLSPDFLFMNFTEQLGYKEYFNDDDEIFFCEPGGVDHRRRISRLWDPEASRVDRAHLSLESDFNNTASFYNNYYYCELLCNHHSIDWLYSAPRTGNDSLGVNSFTQEKRVDSLINQFVKAGDEADEFLLARDFIHPGVLPHQQYAEAIFDGYMAQYGSEVGK